MWCEQAIWSREEGWPESFQDPHIAAAARVYRRPAKMVRKPAEEAEERSEAEAQGGRHPRTEQVAWWALMRVRLLGVQLRPGLERGREILRDSILSGS